MNAYVRSAAMKAAVVTGPGRLAIEDIPVPEPGPGEVRLRIRGCGVCASNLVPWSGPEWMTFPTEPGGLGHEGWGVVDALGEGVEGLDPGQPVAALTYHAYAGYDIGPASHVLPLPQALATRPFPGEPFGCAMNIFERADIRAGHMVAIVGIGFLGAILTRLATRAGACVLAVSRRQFSLDVALKMGAQETLALGSDRGSIVKRISEMTEGTLCDRVIEATGKQAPLDLSAELARERGRLVIAGYHQDGSRQVDMQLWNWRGLDVINAHERDPAIYLQGIARAIAAVEDGTLDPDAFLTHRYPLARLGEALDATRDRPDGFLKAWVEMP